MRCQRLALVGALLLSCVAHSSRAQEQSLRRTWQDLQRSTYVGQSLRVELRSGGVRLGRTVAVDDSSLVLRVFSRPVGTRFPRQAISRVRVKTGSAAGTRALVGAGIGGGLVASAIVISGESFVREGELGALGLGMTVLAMLFGSVVGGLVGNEVATYEDYHVEER